MLAKLALRNVKRQTLSYIIYFITVAFTVALMYAVNNILLNRELRDVSFYIDAATGVLTALVVIITLIMGFVIGYVTVFLLRKRKKEFGIYMLLGIDRNSVLKLFLIENLIIGIVSFFVGFALGLGVFQIFNALICSMMGSNFPPLVYAQGSFWLAFGQWAAIYLVTMAYSTFKLSHTRINDLLSDRETPLKKSRFANIAKNSQYLIFGLAIVGLIIYEISLYVRMSMFQDSKMLELEAVAGLPLGLFGITACIFLIPKSKLTERILSFVMAGVILTSCVAMILLVMYRYGGPKYWFLLILCAIVIFCAIFLFYYFTRSFYSKRLELREKSVLPSTYGQFSAAVTENNAVRLRSTAKLKSANVFHYRQMSSSLNANAMMISIIGLLLSVAMCFSSYIFTQRALDIEEIYSRNPFNVQAHWRGQKIYEENTHIYTPEGIIESAQQYSDLTFCRVFNIYHTAKGGGSTEQSQTFNYEFVKQSDANALLQELGMPLLELGSVQYYMIENYQMNAEDIEILGQTLSCKGVLGYNSYYRLLFNGAITSKRASLVISDDIAGKEIADYICATSLRINTKNPLPSEFYNEYIGRASSWTGEFSCRDYYLDSLNAQSSFFVTAALFMSIAFMFVSMALISLKVTANADLDKKRYAVLSRLGVSAGQQKRMIFRQIFGFFMIPMIIPLFMSGASTAFCAALSSVYSGIISLSVYTVGITAMLANVGIYLAYLTATYYLAVQSSVTKAEKPKLQIFENGGGEEHAN